MARKNITVSADDFDVYSHRAGQKQVVADTRVPPKQVWYVDSQRPIEVALSSQYREDDSGNALTVNEGTTTTIDLSAEGIPAIPQPVFMDSPVDGQYNTEACLVTYFDSDGNGSPDTLVTGSSTVQYSSFTTNSNGDITEITYEDTSGNTATKNIKIIAVQKQGQAELRKQNQGITQVLKSVSERSFVYSAPDDPDSDKQVTFPRSIRGEYGKTLPPEFRLEVAYYDNDEAVDLNATDVENFIFSIPMEQEALRGVSATELRRAVRQDMLQAQQGNGRSSQQ